MSLVASAKPHVQDGRGDIDRMRRALEGVLGMPATEGNVVDVLRNDKMPPVQYKLIHSEARLSDAERQQLERGLVASWTKDPPGK